MNRAKTTTDAAGRVSIRAFDLMGHLRTLHSFKAEDKPNTICHVSSVVYAADGQPLRIDYGNSSHSVYTYDELTNILSRQRPWRNDGTVLEDLLWIYDCAYLLDALQ
jgi:hypothetical protein